MKSVKGNSLAEFLRQQLMVTLAATAAPKLSEMSEGAKARSHNELDKMVKQASQFYQDTADIEGRDVCIG